MNSKKLSENVLARWVFILVKLIRAPGCKGSHVPLFYFYDKNIKIFYKYTFSFIITNFFNYRAH